MEMGLNFPNGVFLFFLSFFFFVKVLLPPGYLQNVYQHVRAAGGICIADEVWAEKIKKI